MFNDIVDRDIDVILVTRNKKDKNNLQLATSIKTKNLVYNFLKKRP